MKKHQPYVLPTLPHQLADIALKLAAAIVLWALVLHGCGCGGPEFLVGSPDAGEVGDDVLTIEPVDDAGEDLAHDAAMVRRRDDAGEVLAHDAASPPTTVRDAADEEELGPEPDGGDFDAIGEAGPGLCCRTGSAGNYTYAPISQDHFGGCGINGAPPCMVGDTCENAIAFYGTVEPCP